MTYLSLKIRVRPEASEQSEQPAEERPFRFPVFQALDNRTDQCSPSDLDRWARLHGLRMEYIDNCWFGVAVTAAQLRVFYRDVLGEESGSALQTRVSESASYFIEAEEF